MYIFYCFFWCCWICAQCCLCTICTDRKPSTCCTCRCCWDDDTGPKIGCVIYTKISFVILVVIWMFVLFFSCVFPSQSFISCYSFVFLYYSIISTCSFALILGIPGSLMISSMLNNVSEVAVQGKELTTEVNNTLGIATNGFISLIVIVIPLNVTKLIRVLLYPSILHLFLI